MRRAFAVLALLLFLPGSVFANERRFRATLIGYQEAPAIVSEATGSVKLTISKDETSIDYVLNYSGFDSTVLQSHIHIGQLSVNGGVSAFFCGGPKPACPQDTTGAPVTGTITAADVLGPAAQGVPAGQLDLLIQALRAGVTYANVHTANHPGGEIRGQLK